jgi:ABC-2 type transport system ATP-binding protein
MEKLAIEALDLTKTFELSTPGKGILGSFRRTRRKVDAVKNLSFQIAAGERVAFIGPNGAGKSTTIKMLTGILLPSSGQVLVNGINPWHNRLEVTHRMGIVFGQRSQLWSHLPVRDSFRLLGAIYGIPDALHLRREQELSALLELEQLLDVPVAKLSLGERMRCELVAALLHRPQILFLDEPTIGLDISARALLRGYIKRISETEKVTILLTSHDTADMAQVCERVLVINHGSVLLDRSVRALRNGYINAKRVQVLMPAESTLPVLRGVRLVEQQDCRFTLEVSTDQTTVDTVIRALLEYGSVQDITIEDPPLEEIILKVYQEPRAAAGGTHAPLE